MSIFESSHAAPLRDQETYVVFTGKIHRLGIMYELIHNNIGILWVTYSIQKQWHDVYVLISWSFNVYFYFSR